MIPSTARQAHSATRHGEATHHAAATVRTALGTCPWDAQIEGLQYSLRLSGINNEGTEAYKSFLGVGFPLHKPYIQLM